MDKYSEILKKYNYNPSQFAVGGATATTKSAEQRIAELNAEVSIPQERKTVAEKVADITGGKEISQGFGQALAMRGNVKRIEETQKQQFDLQGQLIQQIKTAKEQGRDTTRLENALNLLNQDIAEFGGGAEQILNPEQLTSKEVIGDALQLATTAGGAKIAGAVAGKATGATGAVQGALQGAKAGALGGTAVGALSGTAQGLQENGTTEDVLRSTATGAIAGGVGGAVLGGVTGAVSGRLAGKTARQQEKVLENITPKATELKTKEYERLLRQGKISPKTATSPAQYILSDQEKDLALRYSNLIKKDPVKTVSNISNEIGRQDADVGNYLRQNNNIFNKGELKNNLKVALQDITDVAIDEKRLNKTKTTLINNFVDSLERGNVESLWQARKAFDGKIEKAFSGSPTLQKEMKIALRNAVQDFISERTDDVTYKSLMKEMSGLFRLQDTVLTKAVKERGENAISLWVKENPMLAKLLGIGAGAVVAKEVGIIGN